MAVRQYVGARYVPKFADPVAWKSGTSYEALTIVTYNNSSYTSKVPVPATVGNPADNDEYWALTGNYNAQVEAYREEAIAVQENLTQEISDREEADTTINNTLAALNSSINSLKKRGKLDGAKIVCIGDSYGLGYYDSEPHSDDGWVYHMKLVIPEANVINYCTSGAGIIGVNPTTTFMTEAQQAVSDGNNDADYVIVQGGTNDIVPQSSSKSVQGELENLITYLLSNFYSNARIIFIWNSLSYRHIIDGTGTVSTYQECYRAYSQECRNRKIPFYNVTPAIRFTANSVSTDNYHLAHNGYIIDGLETANILLGGGLVGYEMSPIEIAAGNESNVRIFGNCFAPRFWVLAPISFNFTMGNRPHLQGWQESDFTLTENSNYHNLLLSYNEAYCGYGMSGVINTKSNDESDRYYVPMSGIVSFGTTGSGFNVAAIDPNTHEWFNPTAEKEYNIIVYPGIYMTDPMSYCY